MCLSVIVRAPEAERSALASAVAALPSGALRAELQPAPSWASRWLWGARDARVLVWEGGSCSCGLLSDEADWSAATWAMLPELREPLARTLEHIAARAPAGTVVEALWAGDDALVEVAVTPAALGALARTGALGTRTRYLVAGAGPDRAAQLFG